MSPTPEQLEEYQERERLEYKKYAKKGIIYGSACFTDFSCACDCLQDYFESGVSVEQALHLTAMAGADLDCFDYEMTPEERAFNILRGNGFELDKFERQKIQAFLNNTKKNNWDLEKKPDRAQFETELKTYFPEMSI